MALRWGIVSAGKISHDFVNALTGLEPGEHEVVAVAARDLDRAKNFAQKFEIKKSYSSYQQLATDSDIEIAYIGALNPQHYEIAKLMLENGKHVLCEKPLCLNHKQAKSLIDFAKSRKLFLMEAVWSRFFPAYQELLKEIKAGSIGEILQVNCTFGAVLEGVERLTQKDLGGGTVLDLGIYTIQFAQFVFKDFPEKVTATGVLNNDGVDLSTNTILSYSQGRNAVLSTHSRVQFPNDAYVFGTKGTIKVHGPFWCPTKLTKADGTTLEFKLPEAKFNFSFINSNGLCYQAVEVKKCIRAGLLECPMVSHADSLDFARLEDAIRAQIGVKYSVDD